MPDEYWGTGIMELMTAALLCVFPAVMIAAALRDVTTMTIPNWMSGVLIAAFFPAAFVAGVGPGAMLVHLAVAAGVLVVAAGMFALRWLGGGDAKIMAAASLWLGLGALAEFVLFTALAGGAFALALLQARRFAPSYAAGPVWLGRLLTPNGDVPYGVAIAIGALAAYPASALAQRFPGAF